MKNLYVLIQQYFTLKKDSVAIFWKYKYFLCFLLVFLCAGCSWLPGKTKVVQSEPVDRFNTGKIVNATLLKEGGRLLIVPFSAGANVSADEELDSTALRIVQGIVHRLRDNKPYFDILLADNAEDADLFIEGHITKLYEPSFFAYWFLGKKKNIVDVSGRLTTRDTGEVIVIFKKRIKSSKKDDKFTNIGFKIGKNIGDFILSGVD